jgi:hypothetical protein
MKGQLIRHLPRYDSAARRVASLYTGQPIDRESLGCRKVPPGKHVATHNWRF